MQFLNKMLAGEFAKQYIDAIRHSDLLVCFALICCVHTLAPQVMSLQRKHEIPTCILCSFVKLLVLEAILNTCSILWLQVRWGVRTMASHPSEDYLLRRFARGIPLVANR